MIFLKSILIISHVSAILLVSYCEVECEFKATIFTKLSKM